MEENRKLNTLQYTGLAFLLFCSPFVTQADQLSSFPTNNLATSNNSVELPPIRAIDTSTFATEATSDTDEKFEAILFDQQSQITYGKLYWDKKTSTGTIKFEYGNNTDEIQLNISDINEIEPSQRYSVLLDGLFEAGIAQFNMPNDDASTRRDHAKEILSLPITPRALNTIGAFTLINPAHRTTGLLNMDLNIVRLATGWGYDPDRPSESTWIHFYGRRGSEQKLEYIGPVFANESSPEVNRTFGISGSHGWSAVVPEGWDIDNNGDLEYECKPENLPIWGIYYRCQVEFYGYVIDRTGDGNSRFINSPYTISTLFPVRP